MKKLLSLLCSFSLVLCCNWSGPSPRPAPAAERPLAADETLIKSSLFVDGPRYAATAFVYRGHILTAAHVCQAMEQTGPAHLQVALDSAVKLTDLADYLPVRASKYADVCEIAPVFAKSAAVRAVRELPPAKQPALGDPLACVGAPAGVFPMMTKGVYAGVPLSAAQVVVAVPSYFGNSGGPVMDRYGDLVGMLVGGHPTYNYLSVIVPLAAIDYFVDNE